MIQCDKCNNTLSENVKKKVISEHAKIIAKKAKHTLSSEKAREMQSKRKKMSSEEAKRIAEIRWKNKKLS